MLHILIDTRLQTVCVWVSEWCTPCHSCQVPSLTYIVIHYTYATIMTDNSFPGCRHNVGTHLTRKPLACTSHIPANCTVRLGTPHRALPLPHHTHTHTHSISFHLVVCLTTGPKSLPKRALHIVRSTASSFK